MSNMISFLEKLEEASKEKHDEDVFKQKELKPVILQKAGPGSGQDSDGKKLPPGQDAEIITTQPPESEKKKKKGKSKVEVKIVGKKEKKEACPTCKGTGEKDGKECPDCKGTGEKEKSPVGECPDCKGTGEKDGKECPSCGGTGKESPELKEQSAKITRRTETGEEAKEAEESLPRTLDSHGILEKGDASEAKEISEKIFAKAEKQRADIEERTGSEQRGQGEGSFIEKIKGIYKSRIDWVKELKKVIQAFKTKFAKSYDRRARDLTAKKYKFGMGHTKTKSYPSWLKNPRSHSQQKGQPDMLFKGPYVKAPLNEIVLIVALDTSGSVPYKTIEKCMGEMDSIARNFKSGISTSKGKLEGKVYFMMWDWVFQSIDEYKAGDWKKYRESGKKGIVGRGGTRVSAVYEYLNERFKYEKGSQYGVLSVLGAPTKGGLSKDEFIFPVKEGRAQVAPFVVIVTDGYTEAITNENLGGLYQDNHNSIVNLIIDGTSENAFPKNIIKYESYKI